MRVVLLQGFFVAAGHEGKKVYTTDQYDTNFYCSGEEKYASYKRESTNIRYLKHNKRRMDDIFL